MWRTPEGWTGQRYRLRSNKNQVLNAETYAIYRALRILDQRQEGGYRYTVFVDSTAAIDRIQTDTIGPGQRSVVAAMEVCFRILSRDNKVTVRWVPHTMGSPATRRRASTPMSRPRATPLVTASPTSASGRPASHTCTKPRSPHHNRSLGYIESAHQIL